MVRIPCDKYTQGNQRLMMVILKVPGGLIILQQPCKPCQDSLLNQSLQIRWADWLCTDGISNTSLRTLPLHNYHILIEPIKHDWPLSVQYQLSFKLRKFAEDGRKWDRYILRENLWFGHFSSTVHADYVFLYLVAPLYS